MRLLKWITLFAFCFAVLFGVKAYKETKAVRLSHISYSVQNMPDTVQRIGTDCIISLLCGMLTVCMAAALIVLHLRNERDMYKREMRVYGREISGFREVFIFKVISAVLLFVGFGLFVFGAYKVGSCMPSAPLANNNSCTLVSAKVLYSENGQPYYTFTAYNGVVISKDITDRERLFISKDNTIDIRYLIGNPQQNSVDFIGFYIPGAEAYVNIVFLGMLLAALAIIAFVIALALGSYNVYSNRRRGYVRRFDTNIDTSKYFENYDDLDKKMK